MRLKKDENNYRTEYGEEDKWNKDTSEKVDELFTWADRVTKNFDKSIKSLWQQMKEVPRFKRPTPEEARKIFEEMKKEWSNKPLTKKKSS